MEVAEIALRDIGHSIVLKHAMKIFVTHLVNKKLENVKIAWMAIIMINHQI
jgi:hypothetical protein